jgi:hypothetical protein
MGGFKAPMSINEIRRPPVQEVRAVDRDPREQAIQRLASQERPHRRAIHQEVLEVLGPPVVAITVAQLDGERERDRDGTDRVPVRHHEPHAAAGDARVLVAGGGEPHRLEADPGKVAAAQRVDQRVRLDPGRADQLEGRVGPAADRDVRRLQQADAGVEESLRHRTDVRRGIHPRQPGLVEPAAAIPSGQRHDRQVDGDPSLGGRHARELADREARADRDRVRPREGFEIGVEQRPLHEPAGDRIRTIEHDDRQSAPRRLLHHVDERREVRVVAGAHVLHVEDEHRHAVQHGGIRTARAPVEAPDRPSRDRVPPVRDVLALQRARDPVLRREDRS